jgi:hypothetical protein
VVFANLLKLAGAVSGKGRGPIKSKAKAEEIVAEIVKIVNYKRGTPFFVRAAAAKLLQKCEVQVRG